MGRPKKIVLDDTAADPSDFETRNRIIQASKTLFAEKGFKGVSVKDIAEAVNITPAALYYYFPDGKEALFMAVLNHILDERKKGMEQAISSGTCIQDRLFALTMYFLTAGNNAVLPVLMRDVAVQLKNERARGEFWHRLGGDYAETITKVFKEAAISGEITPDVSPELLATIFSGMNFSLGRNLHPGHGTRPGYADMAPEKLARTIVDILFNGIRGL